MSWTWGKPKKGGRVDWNFGPPYTTLEIVVTAVVFLVCMAAWRLYSGN
jgi:hypothetical protein